MTFTTFLLPADLMSLKAAAGPEATAAKQSYGSGCWTLVMTDVQYVLSERARSHDWLPTKREDLETKAEVLSQIKLSFTHFVSVEVHFRSIFIVNAFNFTLNSLERTQNNLTLWTNLTFFVHSFTITLSVIWSSVRLMNVSHSLFQLWFWSPSAADVSLSSLVIKCITAVTSALLTVSVYCLLLGRYCHSGFKSFFCAENSLNWCHESTKIVPVKVWA